METIGTNIPELDEDFINQQLYRLVTGPTCDRSQMEQIREPSSSLIYVRDKDIVDGSRSGRLIFEGRILYGGILEGDGVYMSDDRNFRYQLENSSLTVTSVCTQQSITVTNFNQAGKSLGINLSDKPEREVAIVLNLAQSMSEYVVAFKDIAPYIAAHILKPTQVPAVYAKLTLVTFTSLSRDDRGTFYSVADFVQVANSLKVMNSQTRMMNYALINGMANFTKDNKLGKEVILIADGIPNDPQGMEKMLQLTQNLNQNITRNSGGCKDNCVKIHTIALAPNLEFLQKLASVTGGQFYHASNVFDFKKQLLTLSADGKPFDMRELDNVIRPSEIHKLWDPDDPNDNPPPQGQGRE